jgi:hypothetical protein
MDQIHEYSSSDEAEEDFEPIELVRPADPKFRALIRNFFNTFQGANMRESVYGLDIAGMIDHTDGEHKGHCSILYKLPGTIGIQSRERPAENLMLRAPVTLQSLLGESRKKASDLRSVRVSSWLESLCVPFACFTPVAGCTRTYAQSQ